MVSCKFSYQETCVFIYGERVYLVIQMYFMQIHGNKFTDFFYTSEFFVDPTHNVKRKRKQNSEKIQNSIWRQIIKSDYEQQTFVL